jgi:hypothetical protein
MPDCLASGQSSTGMKKTMPERVRYRTKLTQSGFFKVWYWTKLRDAGMPMPALVSSIPMPSYDNILKGVQNGEVLYMLEGIMLE